jgi:hypothetical protein
MSWPCRCRRAVCQARQNTRFKPETYKRPKRCKSCGKGELRVDYWRKRNELHRPDKTCRPDRTGCCGYHFPHRRGSKWCDENPKLTMEMREERSTW